MEGECLVELSYLALDGTLALGNHSLYTLGGGGRTRGLVIYGNDGDMNLI